jgi:hypothetical protein
MLRLTLQPGMAGRGIGEVARREVPAADIVGRRLGMGAERGDHLAAGVEAAAGGWIDRIGRIARDRSLLGTLVRIHRRHGGEQRLGVGMPRPAEDRFGRPDLGDLAEIHHHHPIRHEAHHVEIMGDEDEGEAELVLEVEQEIEHLRLDRLVERRDRLVEDEEARLERQRARDVDALTLAAGDLVRVAPGEACGLEPDTMEQIVGARGRRAPAQPVHARPERDGVFHGEPRIERGVAVLEYHLDLLAELGEVERGRADRLAVEQDLAEVRRDDLHDQARRG